jgi:hypothetical protein
MFKAHISVMLAAVTNLKIEHLTEAARSISPTCRLFILSDRQPPRQVAERALAVSCGSVILTGARFARQVRQQRRQQQFVDAERQARWNPSPSVALSLPSP